MRQQATIAYFKMPTGIWLCTAFEGDTESGIELFTRTGGRSARAAKKVVAEMTEKLRSQNYFVEIEKA